MARHSGSSLIDNWRKHPMAWHLAKRKARSEAAASGKLGKRLLKKAPPEEDNDGRAG